ncbi:O-antigen ligase family protein [Aquipseudomonas alcaligenes]|uniref:O-antigen ligase family protein n=1 Tax=Aquipseudomonas alcaligenes TaxID=43263 RepID=UPI001F418786|nr:O-antigen ligase family protein [Pseudomonas alcaligenes]
MLLSLSLGVALVWVEGQLFFDWRMIQFVWCHFVWLLLVLLHGFHDRVIEVVRCAVLAFIVMLALVNVGEIADNQRTIAMLEFGFIFVVVAVFGRHAVPGRWVLCWWLGVVVVLVASNILAIRDGGEGVSWWRAVEVFLHLLLGWGFFVWAKRDLAAPWWVASAVISATLLYLVVLVGVWVGLDHPEAYDWFFHPPLFHHIRHLGYLLCVGASVGAWLVLVVRKSLLFIVWPAYVLVLAMLLWSGGRGAFLGAAVGVISLLWLGGYRHERARWVLLVAGMALALWCSSRFPVEHQGLGWLSAVLRSGAAESVDGLSTGRIEIWNYLWRFILDRPLFGWGGEGFLAVWTDGVILQAHNFAMQLMIEWGAGLLMITLPLVVLLARSLYRCARAPWGADVGWVGRGDGAFSSGFVDC